MRLFTGSYRNEEEISIATSLTELTGRDVIVWEKCGDDKFRSTNPDFPFIVKKVKNSFALLVESTFVEALLFKNASLANLLQAIEKQQERQLLDSEFTNLVVSYQRP